MTDVVDTGVAADTSGTDLPVDGAITDPATQAAIAKMYKVKIDGIESEVDEAELLRGYGHSQAANKRMAEAKEQRSQAEEVLRIFKQDPTKAFTKLGVDVKQWAEQVLRQEMEDAMLSPQEKELRELRAMAQDMKTKEQEAKDAQSKAAEKAYIEQTTQELQQGIMNALQTSDLPRNEFTVGRIAYYMDGAIQAGYDQVKPQDVVPMVKQEYEKEIRKLMVDMEGDKLLSFLGDDVSKKMIKAHVAKVGAKKQNTLDKPVQISRKAPANDEEARAKKFSSFFRNR